MKPIRFCLPVALTWAVFLLGIVLSSHFDLNRWDNFEFYCPVLFEAHGQWLHGHLPLINWHQNLGEPLLGNAQPGVFYFPYTFCVAVVKLFHLSQRSLILVVVVLHLTWASIGWYALLRYLNVRRWVALVSTTGVCFNGFLCLISPAWVFMPVIFSWIPWILRGTFAVLRQENDRPLVWFWAPVGLAATACVGYPQMTVYLWLMMGLFCLIYASAHSNRKQVLLNSALVFLIGGLLSMPSMLAYFEVFLGSARASSMPINEFLDRSVSLASLWSFILPVFDIDNGYLSFGGGMTFFQGVWIAPMVLAAIALPWSQRRMVENRSLFKQLAIFGFLTAVMVIFALGSSTPIYPLTFHLPLWSSLRYPFKFLLLGNALMAICAALALEYWLRVIGSTGRKAVALVLGLIATFLLLIAMQHFGMAPNRLNILIYITALTSVLAIPWLDRRVVRNTFITCCLVSSSCVLALAHGWGLKPYQEPYGVYTSEVLGLRTSDRLVPFSAAPTTGPVIMQPLGLFHSATMNGYASLTGHVMALIPASYVKMLPVEVSGLVMAGAVPQLAGSFFLKSLNVGYALVANDDKATQQLLTKHGFTREKNNRFSTLFRDPGVLPKAYFASKIAPFVLEDFQQGMLENKAAPDVAYLETVSQPLALGPARVLSTTWGSDRITLRVEAPSSGYLVVSACHSPQWQVFVDGQRQPLLRVNGLVLGVNVPAGSKVVEFRYVLFTLPTGLLCALMGGVLLIFMQRRYLKQIPINRVTP